MLLCILGWCMVGSVVAGPLGIITYAMYQSGGWKEVFIVWGSVIFILGFIAIGFVLIHQNCC